MADDTVERLCKRRAIK